MKRPKKNSNYIENDYDELNEDDSNSSFDDGYESEYGEELDDMEDFSDIENDPETKKIDTKKEYYVKGADLIAEIKKYQDSKKTSTDGRGVISEELRHYDSKDLYKILNASKILWLYISR